MQRIGPIPRTAWLVVLGLVFLAPLVRGAPRRPKEEVQLARHWRLPDRLGAPTAPASDDTRSGMVLVEGNYCPDVEQPCRRWLDSGGRYASFRCAEYGPSVCLSKQKKKMRFWIDRDEHRRVGESLPQNHASLVDADEACAREGKRACRESEWNLACEGEEMRPYSYGFTRDSSACNADRSDIVDASGKLRDLRAPGGAYAQCVSPFGVRDMTGNLEEVVMRDLPGLRAAMKGAYWQPGRNNCRASETAHDAHYGGAETGFRCCAVAD